MPFIARKSFFGDGVQYRPGDVVPDSFKKWPRPESLIRTGFVVFVDKAPAQEVKPKKAPAKKAEPAPVPEADESKE